MISLTLISSIHCFNDRFENKNEISICSDMEVSYYIECQSIEGHYSATCLNADKRSAVFKFEIDDNLNDAGIKESNQLWTRIEPLLKRSFGRIEVILSMEKIETKSVQRRKRSERSSKKMDKESVKIQVEMRPVRNSAKDMELLLTDDKTACRKFLSLDSVAKSDDSCWNENTKGIFLEEGIDFKGVDLFRQENNSSNIKIASSTTSTTTPSTTAHLTVSTTATTVTKTATTHTSTTTHISTATTHQTVISKPINELIPREHITSSSYSWCYSWCNKMNYTKCQLTVDTDFLQCECVCVHMGSNMKKTVDKKIWYGNINKYECVSKIWNRSP